jgi:hypothetical protein
VSNLLSDPFVWKILGGMMLVFVAPAVTILLIPDIIRLIQDIIWKRKEKAEEARGFEVKLPPDS